jgi:hypothetical protein
MRLMPRSYKSVYNGVYIVYGITALSYGHLINKIIDIDTHGKVKVS